MKVRTNMFSLEGWEWREWLKGNWPTIKELGKVLAPAVLSWLATHDPMWSIVGTGLGKLALDVVHYWLKEK